MTSSLILNQSGFVLANARVLAAASQAAYHYEADAMADNSPGSEIPCQLAPQAPECARLGRENLKTAANEGFSTTQNNCLPLTQASPSGSRAVSLHSARMGTHATVTAYDDCTVIAFRGTASLRDWLTDAEFPLHPLPGSPARVHEGFLTAINSILPDLLALLIPPRASNPEPRASLPILLTGHSLGGALAVLAAWLFQAQGLAVHSVYTYGQPRVGDRTFAKLYSSRLGARTYRTVNQNDLVPRVPGVLLGYRHAGELVFLNALGELVLNPAWLGRLISDGLGLYRAYRRLDDVLITDHFVAGYVAALNRAGAETSNSKLQTSEKLQIPSSNGVGMQVPARDSAGKLRRTELRAPVAEAPNFNGVR